MGSLLLNPEGGRRPVPRRGPEGIGRPEPQADAGGDDEAACAATSRAPRSPTNGSYVEPRMSLVGQNRLVLICEVPCPIQSPRVGAGVPHPGEGAGAGRGAVRPCTGRLAYPVLRLMPIVGISQRSMFAVLLPPMCRFSATIPRSLEIDRWNQSILTRAKTDY